MVGAVIGAGITSALYVANNQGSSFSWGELAVAATGGAVAGGLIGSGLAIIAGPAATASAISAATFALNAGSGAGGAAVGYLLSNPNDFSSIEYSVATVGSGATAAVSANVGSAVAKVGVNIAGSVLQRGTSKYMSTGELMTAEEFGGAALSGALAGVADVAFSSVGNNLAEGSDAFRPSPWVNATNQDLMRVSARQRWRLAATNTGFGLAGGIIGAQLDEQLPSIPFWGGSKTGVAR